MSSFFISLLSNQLLSVGTGLSGIVLTNYLLSDNSVNKNIDNDYVLIKKNIPSAPKLPINSKLYKPYNLNINIKTRFINFDSYKKYLKNKKKRHQKKLKKYNNNN